MGQNEQAEPGVKHDEGKLRMDLLLRFPRALQAIAAVGQRGLAEYAENGWEKVPNGKNRYRAAQLRHQFDGCVGDGIDRKSGLPHAWHEAWNVLAWLELTLRDEELWGEGPSFALGGMPGPDYRSSPGTLEGAAKALADAARHCGIKGQPAAKDDHTNKSYCGCGMCEAVRATFPKHGARNGATEEG